MRRRKRGPDPDAGLIVNATGYDVTQAFLPITRYEGAPFEDAPPPPNVPGRDTPAVHLTATPPAAGPAAETRLPAGGSNAPGDLPPHLLDWVTAQALAAHIMAELENEPARSAIARHLDADGA